MRLTQGRILQSFVESDFRNKKGQRLVDYIETSFFDIRFFFWTY